MLCGGVTGSDRVRMHNDTFCTTTIAQNVSLRMTVRATGSDVTPKGFPSVCACATGVPALLSGVFIGNYVTPKGVERCADAQPEVGGSPALFPGIFSRTFFAVLFPHTFPRTFFPYFVPVHFFSYFFPRFPALYSYYCSSTVVQVPWLPVSEGHVTPKRWQGVRMRNQR